MTAPHIRPRIRRRYHVGPGGWLYVGVTVLVALGAFNSQNNLLFWSFGLSLALLVVSGIISGAMLMGVRVERDAIASAAAGDPVRISYRVRNLNRLVPIMALTIEEIGHEPPTPPSLVDRLLRKRPASDVRPIRPPMGFVPYVGPRSSIRVEGVSRAVRRGRLLFLGVRVHTSFPFGLIRKSVSIEQAASAVVTPEVLHIAVGDRVAAAPLAPVGSMSRRSGLGDEFHALREYRPGDSPRDVAWRATARRGSLLVRQSAAPNPRRLWIVLHLRTHAGHDALDERAIALAAGLAETAERQGVEFGLVIPLSRTLVHPRRGFAHRQRVMIELGLVDLAADDGRGARSAFPTHVLGPGAAVVVVHAGPSDSGFGGNDDRVTHVSAADTPGASQTPAGQPAPTTASRGRAA